MERLIIRLIETDAHGLHAQWALFNAAQKIACSDGALPFSTITDELPVTTAGRRITVIVPGQHVLLTSVNVPRGQKRHLRKVLPFLIEEKLADPITAVHIAAGAIDNKGYVPAAVIKHALMQDWLDALGSAGIHPHEMLAEHSLLTGEWQIVCDTHSAWLRVDKTQCFAVDAIMLPDLIKLLLQGSAGSILVHCTVCSPEAEELLMQLQKAHPQHTLHTKTADSAFDVFCEACVHPQTSAGRINLLQGKFRPSASISSRNIWKELGKIAALWIIGMLLINGGEAAYLSYKAVELREQSVALYKQLFPANTRIIDPRQQMESHLTGLSSAQAGFLPTLQHIARSWTDPGDPSLQMRSISYREGDGSATLNITGSSIDLINKLVQQLNAGGLHAKTQSVANNAEGITAQVLIQGDRR